MNGKTFGIRTSALKEGSLIDHTILFLLLKAEPRHFMSFKIAVKIPENPGKSRKSRKSQKIPTSRTQKNELEQIISFRILNSDKINILGNSNGFSVILLRKKLRNYESRIKYYMIFRIVIKIPKYAIFKF